MNTNNNDEYSIVDMISVLISQRWLILFGTFICSFIVFIWLFICPVVFKNYFITPEKYKVIYTVNSINPPSCVLKEIGNNATVAAMAQARMDQLKFILKQNRVSPVFGGLDKHGYDYNIYVKKQVEKKKFKVGFVLLGTEFDVSCELEEVDFEKFGSFVKSCVTEINKSLENYIFPIMDNVDTEEHPDVITYKNNYNYFISVDNEPFILKNEISNSRGKKFIISSLGFFIFFIVLCFIKNACVRQSKKIKKDKEASAKLVIAWNEGKLKK